MRGLMKTTEEVRDFFDQRPIDNGWGDGGHVVTIEEVNDGDAYCKICIPLWAQNRTVTHGVVKLLSEILEWEPGATVFARSNLYLYGGGMEVHIYQSTCDGE